jgi:sulfide:quinone oxidoreductase
MSVSPASTRKHVLVLGGGFAGVQAAIELTRKGRFDVTLVSERDFLYLFPTSIWIPTRSIAPERVRVPLAKIARAHKFELIISTVERIYPEKRSVTCTDQNIGYDYLVLATGSGKTKYPGGEHTFSLCAGPEDALGLRERIDELIERGSGHIAVGFGGNPKDGSAVRGGPAFEFMLNLHHHLKRRKLRDNFELTFFAPMPSPGERLGKKAVKGIGSFFGSRRIPLRSGTPIAGFDEKGVRFTDDTRLDADVVMFIPAGSGHVVMANSDLPLNEAGFVRIDDHGLVEGTSNVYAVGDVAALDGPPFRAKQGHVAEVMARVAAHNITMDDQGSTEREGYSDHVSVVCLMDAGNGAVLLVRSAKREMMIPLPVVGHWLKRGWGLYARATKVSRMPRLPGL